MRGSQFERFALVNVTAKPAGWVPLALPVQFVLGNSLAPHWRSQWHLTPLTLVFLFNDQLCGRALLGSGSDQSWWTAGGLILLAATDAAAFVAADIGVDLRPAQRRPQQVVPRDGSPGAPQRPPIRLQRRRH